MDGFNQVSTNSGYGAIGEPVSGMGMEVDILRKSDRSLQGDRFFSQI